MTTSKKKISWKIRIIFILIMLILAGLNYSFEERYIETTEEPHVLQKIKQPFITKCLPNKPCSFSTTIKPLITIPPITTKSKAFTLEHDHHCKIKVDDDSRLKVNNAIYQLGHEG